MNNTVAIYVRLSREDEDKIDKSRESRSIENQIKTLKNFAKEQGLTVYNIYADDGYSGGDFNRPAFKQMIDDMKRRRFNVLLLKDLSRLGRSLYKVGDLIENVFPINGIRVISIGDKYDSQFYKDDMSIVLRSFLNDYYLKEFKKKCRKAREHYAQTKHLNYYPKYGYKFNEKGEECIDDYSANIVRKIYAYLSKDNFSCVAVAKLLNEEGVLTRSAYATQVLGLKALHKQSARKWNAEKVWSIATDYEYCGHSINWARHKKEERILIKNTHQAIISEEIYAKVQRGIEKRSKVKRRLEHLGSCIIDARSKRNLLFSQKQQIYFLRENNRKVYSIPKATIEELLFTEALAMVEYWIEQYIKSEREKRKDNIQKHLEDLNCQYAQLIDLRFENRIDEITFLKKQKILLESIKRVEKNKKEKFDFEKLNNLLFGLKKIKKRKLAVIKTVIKACYILEKETDNMRLKIIFLSMHNEIKTKFYE